MHGLLGVAGMIITSDEMDHSRKFPAFSTSKTSLVTSRVHATVAATVAEGPAGHAMTSSHCGGS